MYACFQGHRMDEFGKVLLLAAMPAAGNFLGGLLSEMLPVSRRLLSLALHLAAGIVLGVIGIELMPRALSDGNQPWIVLVMFVLGGAFFILIDKGIGLVRTRTGGDVRNAGAWAIYFGVAVDLFSDGIMIGTGSSLSLGLGLLLALGQVPADVPEGFATIATFKNRGFARKFRLLLSASFAIPIFVGTAIGYFAVRGQPDIVKYALLAFTAGILLTVVVEEMLQEAHEEKDEPLSALLLVGGFALFGLVSAYLG
jgi:ZIP family zinc transporter